MTEKIRFTATAVAKLQPRTQRYIVYDSSRRGLGIRVSPQGTKTAVFLYRFNGKPRFLSLGSLPPRTLEQIIADYSSAAKDVADARHMLVHEQQTPPPDLDPVTRKRQRREARRIAGTVAELWKAYREKKLTGIRASTLYEYDRMWTAYILPEIGQSRADDVRPKTIKALLNKVEEKGPIMANRVRALLAAIFRYGKDQFIIEANPVKEVKAPGKERRRQRALDTEQQLRGFFAALDAMSCSPLVKMALPLVIATAARPGEVCAMRWSDVDLESKTWRLPEEIDKTRRVRNIPLSAFAVELLEQAKTFKLTSKPDSVFPAVRNASIGNEHLSCALREHQALLKQNGLAVFTPHDLRRTARTWLAKLRIPDHIAERCLGHVYGSAIERTYNVHAYDDEIRAAMDLLGTHLMSMRAGENVVALKPAA